MIIIFNETKEISNQKHNFSRMESFPLHRGDLFSFPLLQKPRSVMSYQIPNKKH